MAEKRLIRIATPPGTLGTLLNLQITVDGKPLDGVCEIAIDPIRRGSIIRAIITAYVELDVTVEEEKLMAKTLPSRGDVAEAE